VRALPRERRGKPKRAVMANTELAAFFLLMELAVSKGLNVKNPVDGLSVPADRRPAKSERAPFTSVQLVRCAAPLGMRRSALKTGTTRPAFRSSTAE
jgi:hypothetical protein